jgi:thiaminase
LNHSKLEGNPYKEWILEYGQEEFTAGVDQVLKMIDGWAAKADEKTKEKMDYYYLKAALYEYAFWDYGYHADARSYEYTDSLEEWL